MRRQPAAGFTFVETLMAIGLSTAVLACAYFFFTSMHGATTEQSREVSIAMELTEFLEVLQNDLYHAYYVVHEEEREEPVLSMVLLSPEGGKLVRRVVSYRLARDRKSVERVETQPPGAPERPRKFDFGANDSTGRDKGLSFTSDRARSLLIVKLGNQTVEVSLPASAMAQPGTQADTVAQWTPAPELDVWSPPAPPPADSGSQQQAAAAPIPQDALAEPEPVPGEGLTGTPVDTVSDVGYSFLAGGDEQPVGGSTRTVAGLGETTLYQAHSNLRLPGSEEPVHFLRRGTPPGQSTNPGTRPEPAGGNDWLTLIPNPNAQDKGVALELNRSGGPGAVSAVDSSSLPVYLSMPPGTPVDIEDTSGRTISQAAPTETAQAPTGYRPSAGFDPGTGTASSNSFPRSRRRVFRPGSTVMPASNQQPQVDRVPSFVPSTSAPAPAPRPTPPPAPSTQPY
ncbi:MAG: hypothetical protein HY303_15260 [Candidatus Wallbacteria bacterium]|nr:hypothetical protein [Candidatus Wallbacteria bacterium]